MKPYSKTTLKAIKGACRSRIRQLEDMRRVVFTKQLAAHNYDHEIEKEFSKVLGEYENLIEKESALHRLLIDKAEVKK